MSEKSHFGRALENFKKDAEEEKKIFEKLEELENNDVEEAEEARDNAKENKEKTNEKMEVYHTGNENFSGAREDIGERVFNEETEELEKGDVEEDLVMRRLAKDKHSEKFKGPMDKTDNINCQFRKLQKEADGIDEYKEVLEENLEGIINDADEEIQYINELQRKIDTDDPCYAYDEISNFLAMEKDTVESMKNKVNGVNAKRDEVGDFDLIKQYSQEIEDWANEVKSDIKRICDSNEFAELTLKGIGLRRKYGESGEGYEFGDKEILKDYDLGDPSEVEEKKDEIQNSIIDSIEVGDTSPEYVVDEFKKEISDLQKGKEKSDEEKEVLRGYFNSILKSVTDEVGLEKMVTGLPGSSSLVYDLDTHTKNLENDINGKSEDEVMEEVVEAYEQELRKGMDGRDSISKYLSRPFSAALENVLEEGYAEGLEEVFEEYC